MFFGRRIKSAEGFTIICGIICRYLKVVIHSREHILRKILAVGCYVTIENSRTAIARSAGIQNNSVLVGACNCIPFCRCAVPYKICRRVKLGSPLGNYGCVCSYIDGIANRLFNTVNAPTLETLAGRSSKAVCRERIFAGNTGYISHAACTAVCRKGNGIVGYRCVLPNCSQRRPVGRRPYSFCVSRFEITAILTELPLVKHLICRRCECTFRSG